MQAAPVLLGLGVWAIAYHSTIWSLTSSWGLHASYSHSLAAIPLALYIVWRQRDAIEFRSNVTPATLALLGVLTIGWWLSHVANVLKAEQIATYLLMVTTLAALGGWFLLRVLAYPLLIILFVVPVWDILRAPLQDMTTTVTVWALRQIGVPVLLEGHLVVLPGGRFLIEEACSGLSFLLTATMIAVFYRYLNHLNRHRTVALFAIAVAVSVVANWVRVIAILLVGYHAGMDSPLVTDHLTFGWCVFTLALIPFLMLAHRFLPPDASAPTAKTGDQTSGRPGRASNAATAAVCVALVIVPVTNQILHAASNSHSAETLELPDRLDGTIFKLPAAQVDWYPQFEGASQVVKSAFRKGSTRFAVLLIQYDRQTQGRELINVNNRLYSTRWNEVGDNTLRLDETSSIRVKRLGSRSGRSRLVAYWYIVNGKATANPVMAKVLQVAGVIAGDERAQLLAVAIDENTDVTALAELARPFYALTQR